MSEWFRLKEKRSELANRIRAHADRQEHWTAEDEGTWDRLNAEYDSVKAQLDAVAAGSGSALIGRDNASLSMSPVQNGRAFGRDGASLMDNALAAWCRAASGMALRTEDETACRNVGISPLSNQFCYRMPPTVPGVGLVRNNLTKGTPDKGGYTVGETFMGTLEIAMQKYSAMLGVAETMRTEDGEDLHWPTVDDRSNEGYLIGESVEVSADTDPAFARQTWRAYKLASGVVKISAELLQDSRLNMANVVAGLMGERIGRSVNRLTTLGTGAAQPKGITLRAAAGVTTASGTAIAMDEVIDLIHSIDEAYRVGAGFMFHDNVLKALRKLKDGSGTYLWQPSVQAGQPDQLLGYPITTNPNMASSIASGAITMLFGQLAAYKIRMAGDLRFYRLMERYRETDMEGFIAFLRFDGDLLDAGGNPVKKMTQA